MLKTQGSQILTLTGLRFDANLGILEHEKNAPQPIQVDAELNLGTQPLLPRDDDISHVLVFAIHERYAPEFFYRIIYLGSQCLCAIFAH